MKLYARKTPADDESRLQLSFDGPDGPWYPVTIGVPEPAFSNNVLYEFALRNEIDVGPRYEVVRDGRFLVVRRRKDNLVEESWIGTREHVECSACRRSYQEGWSFTSVQEHAAETLCSQLNQTYYKVANEGGGGYYSVSVAGLLYGAGIRTFPYTGTGLLAFETLEQARGFIDVNCFAFAKVLRGYGALGPKLPRYRTGNSPTEEVARVTWRGGIEDGYSWPEGTVSLAWFEGEEVIK